jgi:hypothetical protein
MSSSNSNQKKPHNPWRMRGLRFPLSGYALPAVSPYKKNERELRTKQFESGNPASAQTNHAAHHVASPDGCQLPKIQLLVLLKTCCEAGASGRLHDGRSDSDATGRPSRDRNEETRIRRTGFMLRLGWRSTSLMLFLAPGASGPEVAKGITGGEAGVQHTG